MSGLDKTEADLKQTTVEEGTQFKGTLQSTCRVVVRGVVDGELHAPDVVVTESGSVTGSVKAQTLQSSGVLAGRIDVDDLVLSGSVKNDTVIRAKTLEVKLQQDDGKLEVRFGECMLEVGDDPGLDLTEPSSGRAAAKKGAGQSSRRNEAQLEASADKPNGEVANKNESSAAT